MDYSQNAIVIGGNHHNTLGVIRSLGRKGVFPYVILTSGNETSFILKSKYIKKSFVVKGSEAAVELLLSEFVNENNKGIVFTCHDIIASQIDLNRNRLEPYFILPGCEEQGRITFLMNKKVMGDLALKNGLNVPATSIINGNLDSSLYPISFPCITKPVESRTGSKSEIHVCNNSAELALVFNQLNGKDLLVQQFVSKIMEFQLIGCSLCSGKDIIIPGYSKILRQPQTTNTGFLKYSALDESFSKTVENTKSYIREIGYSGLFSVEFIRDKQGNDYFMEINFRNDGNSISVTNAGVNLPYIWYLFGIGDDYKNEINTIHDEYVMPEFAELELYKQKIITNKQLIDDMKMATSFMDYALDDPSPTDGWKRYKKQKTRAFIVRIVKTFLNK